MTTSEDSTTPTKRCTKCGIEYPATPDYFHRDGQQLRSSCKVCRQMHARRYIATNRAVHKERSNRYSRANPETVKQYQALYRKRNRDRERERTRQWIQANLDKHRVGEERRRSKKLSLPSTFTVEQWHACLEYFHCTCAYCGVQQDFWHGLEQEHIIPVSRGGGYTADNIVPACKSCNLSKSDNGIHDWLESKFGKRRAKAIITSINLYITHVKD